MVQDQLGPGYVARGHNGDKPTKDDPNAANEYFQRIIKLKQEKSNDEDSNRAK